MNANETANVIAMIVLLYLISNIIIISIFKVRSDKAMAKIRNERKKRDE